MHRAYCRLLLLAFPRDVRDRVGRPLVHTLLEDAAGPGGRVSTGRLVANSADVIRAGLAERRSRRTRARPDDTAAAGASVWTDLRHARRALVARPVFTLTVLATLAVGLGLNTAIFSVVNSVLIAELPYRDPSRLAFMWTKLAWIGVPRAWVAGPHIDRLAREASTIEAIVPIRTTDLPLVGDGDPTIVSAALSTAPLFDVLGVRALHGRTFVEADEPRNVAILGHAIWQQRYGADPTVIGRTMDLGGDRLEIIGVMPADFRFKVHASLGGPNDVDVWLPTRWPLAEMTDSAFSFAALLRVRPGRTLAEAQAELDTIGARLDLERYKSRGFGWQLTAVQDDLVREARPALVLLLAAAGVLLAVVCANVAGLLLVRHGDRRREIVVRSALGARRRDLVRLVVVECLLLAFVAGLAGLGLAAAGVRLLAASSTLPIPRLAEVTIDGRVLAISLAAALASGLLAAVIPAWRVARTNAAPALADAARGSSRRAGRARAVLVAAELALAVLLVAASALLARSYAAIRTVDAGFTPSGSLTADIELSRQRYPEASQATDFFMRVVEAIAAAPGVTAAGATSSAPLRASTDQQNVRPSGWTPPSPETSTILVDLIRATPGYFASMGIAVVAGRDFAWTDRADGQPVVVIDESLARQGWPAGDPVGQTLTLGGETTPATVIGVVRHARLYGLGEDDRPQVYRPSAQDVVGGMTLTVRSAGDPDTLANVLRQAVWSVDPLQPVAGVATVQHAVDDALSGRRLQLEAMVAFAIGAAVLAALGLYGLLAALVAERRREIGIRMALGADGAAVRRLLARYLIGVSGAGLVAGGIAAALAARALMPFLYGVTPADPLALGATLVGILTFVMVAAYLPVRRATSVDPAVALRND